MSQSAGNTDDREVSPYQVMPDLDEETYERLKEDIKRHGVEEPIKVDPDGNVIDGHHRLRACKELGIDPPTIEVQGSEDEQHHRAHRLNFLRRELNGTKREVAKQYLLENAERLAPDADDTHQNIAEDLGVSRSLITEVSNDPDVKEVTPDELNTEDRKELVAEYIGDNPEASNRDIAEALSEEHEDFDTSHVTISKWRKELWPVNFVHNDFTLADIEDESVDHIITDPPYGPNALETWSDLGEFADRVLKPGGFLIAYSGQNYLPDVYQRLSEHLQYIWQFVVLHESSNRHPNHAIGIKHKPVLLFGKGTKEYRGNLVEDVIQGTGREKDDHEWQQSIGEARGLLTTFTKEDDLICDPMCGSGTVGAACVETNRRAILIDRDEEAIQTARDRVGEVVADG